MALGPSRLQPPVGVAERVVAGVRAHARDVDGAVGAEGGDDVVGPAVVQGQGVRGDRGADALGHLSQRRRAHGSEAEVENRLLERIHVDRTQRGGQPLVWETGEEAVDGPLEIRDVSLEPGGQAHVLEAFRV